MRGNGARVRLRISFFRPLETYSRKQNRPTAFYAKRGFEFIEQMVGRRILTNVFKKFRALDEIDHILIEP